MKPEYIVGIGASAGGLEALVQFFSEMPSRTGLSFVVVQHLSPDFKSVMDELLSRHTDMPIHLVEDKVEVEADSVYLIPPKKEMEMSDRCLYLKDKETRGSLSLPIDVFFTSMAKDIGAKGIAIVLSGTGSDGSRGIVDVHDAGGLVIAQDEESAKFNGMPRSATDTGLVDFVLSPTEMPKVLLEHIGGSVSDPGIVAAPGPKTQMDQYLAIFQRLRSAFKTDFSYYKPTTVNRRIERRMQHHKVDTLEQYVAVMDRKPQEVHLLYQDLLIGVTKFFRDLDAFALLEDKVIPSIVRGKSSGEQVRIWVPACATGEEAYSIAILFQEAIERFNLKLDVKIFATDLHAESVTFAAAGIYSPESLELISKSRLERHFKVHGEAYQVNADLRKMIVFAEQNLLKDPPFTKMDFVSCRNLLIYFQPLAQKKVISMFLFSLNVGGTLFLGPSETLGDLEGEFDSISRTWNMYVKRKDVRIAPLINLPEQVDIAARSGERNRQNSSLFGVSRQRREDVELLHVYDALLGEYMPPSLLVGPKNELIQIFGDASNYIRTPRGRTSLDVLNMIEGSLRLAVSTALKRVENKRVAFTLNNVPLDENAEERVLLDITVKPLRDEQYLLVQFLERRGSETTPDDVSEMSFDADAESLSRIFDLEKELQYTRENLQATIEELETTNEELQATNEEMLASNEELQSTNEELQSVNEELFTVNTEYEKKNHELILLNTDIDNLLQSTEIGTVFIDSERRIRKFTPAIASVFNLLPMDIGRPFEHITFNLVDSENISQLVDRVIESREPIIREARDRSGNWHLMRIYPYMTGREQSAGAVLTLVDISAIKETEAALKSRTDALSNAKLDLEQFAYSVSHDMQTPLRAVSGYLDLLKKRLEGEDQELQEYLEFAHSGAFKLKEMINGLLTYTRIETRAADFEEFSLESALNEVLATKTVALEEKGAEVVSESCNLIVYGERRFVVYLLSELIDNALCFVGAGPPRIVVKAEAQDGQTLVSVRDNGRGIEPVNQDTVFKIFYQEKPEQHPEGLGVGLAVCRRIALKHKGTISLDSTPGIGTCVSFTLPSRPEDV
ncbi:chemotaxis protein CheB [Pelagicoccus enzymogenes]|uniref:chemotaxis protein CheB n=1 Tax=Pelagicoccus enzymogenes TaxID=2773457 RepID=UPI002810802E|nr:chemotaxis protein CheB [Pelagicoccus enzymogenes]MDQ8200520.1 chemotaxis protein CheB [Pelagicoccus enzymogenes]